MACNEIVGDITPESIESLRLPPAFNETVHLTVLELDALLSQDERPVTSLDTKMAAYREAAFSHLLTFNRKQTFDMNFPGWLSSLFRVPSIPFRWPRSLYIPGGANSSNYWPFPAPDDHRYGLEWAFPTTSIGNGTSRQDGTQFCFSQLLNEKPQSAQSSESGIGVFYSPPMSLGVININLQPRVDCSGSLSTFVRLSEIGGGGFVQVNAHLLLVAWQQIPGGFDLLGFKQFDVATSGRRDETFGLETQHFQRSFNDPSLSAPFVVKGGRTYLFGVVSRISITSSLFSNNGQPLPFISGDKLRVWGLMNCVVPQINVFTKQVNIP